MYVCSCPCMSEQVREWMLAQFYVSSPGSKSCTIKGDNVLAFAIVCSLCPYYPDLRFLAQSPRSAWCWQISWSSRHLSLSWSSPTLLSSREGTRQSVEFLIRSCICVMWSVTDEKCTCVWPHCMTILNATCWYQEQGLCVIKSKKIKLQLLEKCLLLNLSIFRICWAHVCPENGTISGDYWKRFCSARVGV